MAYLAMFRRTVYDKEWQLQSGQLIKHCTRLIIVPTANNDDFVRSADLPFESAETKAQRERTPIGCNNNGNGAVCGARSSRSGQEIVLINGTVMKSAIWEFKTRGILRPVQHGRCTGFAI